MKGKYKIISQEFKKLSSIILGSEHKAKFSTKIKKQLFTYDKKKKCVNFNLKYIKTLKDLTPKKFALDCCNMIISNEQVIVSAYGLRGKAHKNETFI